MDIHTALSINTYNDFLDSNILDVDPKSWRVKLKGLKSHPQLIMGIELTVH